MENASKALIIAGAILLAILLISLGILIFNQAQDTVNNSGMSQAEITAVNNKFLKYEGTQKGTVVKSMMNEVLTYNKDVTNDRKIVVYGVKDGTLQPRTDTSWIDMSSSYEVKITAYNTPGAIKRIDVNTPQN